MSPPPSYEEQVVSALRQGVILTEAFLDGHAKREHLEVWVAESRDLLEQAK